MVNETTDRATGEEISVSSPAGRHYGWRGYRGGRVTDPLFDLRLALNARYRALARHASEMPSRHVHIASVDVPERRSALESVLRTLAASRHNVTVSLAPLGDRGKFENINLALHDVDLKPVDWLIVVDDDVAFPPRFLDRFLYASEAASLRICQPAHRFRSHTSFQVTQRVWNSLVHTTRFVECGPLTAFHRDVFGHVLPFPETRWSWGLDIIWAEIARREGFRIGVVDATPVEHLRPVAQSYDTGAAQAEMQNLLRRFGVHRNSQEIPETIAVLTRL
jgi:Glycosyltransferase like family 2